MGSTEVQPIADNFAERGKYSPKTNFCVIAHSDAKLWSIISVNIENIYYGLYNVQPIVVFYNLYLVCSSISA